MQTNFKITLAMTALVALAPLAQGHADPMPTGQTPGWYVGGGAGATFTPQAHTKTTTPGGGATLEYEPGWNIEGSGGYAWDNGLRVEGEAFHSRDDINSIQSRTNGGVNNGTTQNTDLFGNVYYDFHTGTMLTPYVGAGVGVALVDSDHIGNLSNGSSLNGSNLELAYQGIAGVAAQVSDHWAVTADYRYIATPDPKVHTTSGRGTYTNNESHNLLVGVRYSFDKPAQPAPMVQQASAPVMAPAAPAPRPAVAPVAQSYTVFFDFNKADLTPEAKRIIASAAHDFQQGQYVRIVVTGHTDTVGSAKYNKKLSERRAAAIKAEFKSLGVDPSQIVAQGVGKNGLLVPTQNGVREAQNRRGEIVFDKQ